MFTIGYLPKDFTVRNLVSHDYNWCGFQYEIQFWTANNLDDCVLFSAPAGATFGDAEIRTATGNWGDIQRISKHFLNPSTAPKYHRHVSCDLESP